MVTQKISYTDAIDDFDHAIILAPNFTIAYFNRGFAYYNVGKTKTNYQKAIADYDMFIQHGGRPPLKYRDEAVAAMDKAAEQ